MTPKQKLNNAGEILDEFWERNNPNYEVAIKAMKATAEIFFNLGWDERTKKHFTNKKALHTIKPGLCDYYLSKYFDNICYHRFAPTTLNYKPIRKCLYCGLIKEVKHRTTPT